MKKILALLLAAVLTLGLVVPSFADGPGLYRYPSIYVKGKIGTLYNDIGTPEQKMIYDGDRVPAPDGYIEEAVKELVPMFIQAMLTDDYDEWAQKMSTVLEPIYKDFIPDKNGKVRPNSGKLEQLDYIDRLTDVDPNHNYWRYSYDLIWDWRLSPMDVADQLRAQVEKVKEVTGKEKVNLIGRCEGCCVIMAYLYKYGAEDIGATVLLSPSSNGVALISDVFAGDFHLDGNAVTRYMEDGEYMSELDKIIEDELVRRVILDTLRLMAVTPGIDLTDRFVNSVFDKILPMVMPGLVMSSYGACASYWAMVDDAHYETAKQLCGLTGNPEYANFVKLIDDYHDNVQLRHVEILEACKAQGMGLGIIVKYGDQMLPFLADSVYPNDNTVTVGQASFGATTAKIGEKVKGEGEFISPDGLIDASTAGLPENTWFVKYLSHDQWEQGIGPWGRALWTSEGTMTVGSDPLYPRFLVFETYVREDGKEDGRFVPMTEENAFEHEPVVDNDPGTALNSFIATFRTVIQRIIDFVKGIIEGIVGHAKGTVPPVE